MKRFKFSINNTEIVVDAKDLEDASEKINEKLAKIDGLTFKMTPGSLRYMGLRGEEIKDRGEER